MAQFLISVPFKNHNQYHKLFNNQSYYLLAYFIKVIKGIQIHDLHNMFLSTLLPLSYFLLVF